MTEHKSFQDEIELTEVRLKDELNQDKEVAVAIAINSQVLHLEDDVHNPRAIFKCCFEWTLEDLLIFISNLISTVWGCYIFSEREIEIIPLTDFSILLLTTFNAIGFALACSLVTTGLAYLFYKLRSKEAEAASVIGCIPFLFLIFLHVIYGLALVLSIRVLNKPWLIEDHIIKYYVVLQLVSAVIVFLFGIYIIFCYKSGISKHLQEIEKDTFHVERTEVEKLRNEVRNRINAYNDKLNVKAPFLTTTNTEQIAIEGGKFVEARKLKKYMPPLMLPDKPGVNIDTKALSSPSINKTGKKSPLKLYRK